MVDENSWVELQRQDDLIRSFFKSTTEPYDTLEWDGQELQIVLDGKIIERYDYDDLKELLPSL